MEAYLYVHGVQVCVGVCVCVCERARESDIRIRMHACGQWGEEDGDC